jgi:hypothetical protein
MDITELASPSADSFKFATIGDTIKGNITYVSPAWVDTTNKFTGRAEQYLKIVIDTPEGEQAIYPKKGSQMAQAIGEAAMKAGAKKLDVGAVLAVRYAEDRDTGKPQPMKVFVAQMQAPAPAVGASDLL